MRFVLPGVACLAVLGFLLKGDEVPADAGAPAARHTTPQPIGVTAALLMDACFQDARQRGKDNLPVPAGGSGPLVVVGEERDAMKAGATYYVPHETLFRTTALTFTAPGLEIAPRQLWQNRARFQIVDVREAGEFAGSHIPGSVRRSMFSDFDSSAKPIALFCLTGHRSAAAVEALRARGLRNVYSVRGGWLDWRRQSLPLDWSGQHSYSRAERT